MGREKSPVLTIINLQPIRPRTQLIIIIPLIQLTKRRQPRRPHPNLKLLPRVQIRQGPIIPPIRILCLPIRRRHHILGLIFRLAIQVPFVRPTRPFNRHGVVLATSRIRSTRWIGERQVGKRVVEHGVCNKTAGVVWQACFRVVIERGAVA